MNATIAAQAERIKVLETENAELTRKGEELCCAYGGALMRVHEVMRALAKIIKEEVYRHIGSVQQTKVEKLARAALTLARTITEPGHDLSKCPKCGGPADNGHDRCLPPTAYYCTKCSTPRERDQPGQTRSRSRRDEAELGAP